MKKLILSGFVLLGLVSFTATAQYIYDASGRQIARFDGERIYDSSGRNVGRVDGEYVYDSSGRSMGEFLVRAFMTLAAEQSVVWMASIFTIVLAEHLPA